MLVFFSLFFFFAWLLVYLLQLLWEWNVSLLLFFFHRTTNGNNAAISVTVVIVFGVSILKIILNASRLSALKHVCIEIMFALELFGAAVNCFVCIVCACVCVCYSFFFCHPFICSFVAASVRASLQIILQFSYFVDAMTKRVFRSSSGNVWIYLALNYIAKFLISKCYNYFFLLLSINHLRNRERVKCVRACVRASVPKRLERVEYSTYIFYQQYKSSPSLMSQNMSNFKFQCILLG